MYVRYLPLYLLYLGILEHSLLGIRAPPQDSAVPVLAKWYELSNGVILDRRTKTDFAVHAKMYSKLQKRVKGCTIPILVGRMTRIGHGLHRQLDSPARASKKVSFPFLFFSLGH